MAKASSYLRECKGCGAVCSGTVGTWVRWYKEHRACTPGGSRILSSHFTDALPRPTTEPCPAIDTANAVKALMENKALLDNTISVDAVTLGKICDAYSADRIADGKSILTVTHGGLLYTCVGNLRGHHADAYRLLTRTEWDAEDTEPPVPYAQHEGAGYHGVSVKKGKTEYVLIGPCVIFAVEEYE